MPPHIAGKTWVPAWTLRDNKSFSELVLDKMKGSTEKPPVKRRKINKKDEGDNRSGICTGDTTNTQKRITEKIYVHKATEKKR